MALDGKFELPPENLAERLKQGLKDVRDNLRRESKDPELLARQDDADKITRTMSQIRDDGSHA